MSVHRRRRYAHRISYVLRYGDIPEGAFVLHRCDNALCVNPDHLFLGDQVANMRDCASKGRIGALVHPECLPRGERHGMVKLTAAEVREIRAAAAHTRRDVLAVKYGVHRSTITSIISGKSWAHMDRAAAGGGA